MNLQMFVQCTKRMSVEMQMYRHKNEANANLYNVALGADFDSKFVHRIFYITVCTDFELVSDQLRKKDAEIVSHFTNLPRPQLGQQHIFNGLD